VPEGKEVIQFVPVTSSKDLGVGMIEVRLPEGDFRSAIESLRVHLARSFEIESGMLVATSLGQSAIAFGTERPKPD